MPQISQYRIAKAQPGNVYGVLRDGVVVASGLTAWRAFLRASILRQYEIDAAEGKRA